MKTVGQRRVSRRGCSWWLLLPILMWLMLTPSLAVAQDAYPVRMRIELLSIRNRSGAPIPVQIKLEYNQLQILQGDLELSCYDALDVVSQDGLLATLRIPDLVLSGNDLIFNTVLPPMQTSGIQNLAVVGWFQTAEERIPLSSSMKEINPPLPHDLLMISPSERATLLCSCTGAPVTQSPGPIRRFLETALSLENYNPLKESEGAAQPGRRGGDRSLGRNIQFYASVWNSRDLPDDPLWHCCFDVVLLVEGALSRLTQTQMNALHVWVRAGGSLCIVPDAPLREPQLEFVRSVCQLVENRATTEADFQLDDNGRLTVSGESDALILARCGLGRAVILPPVDHLGEVLGAEGMGQVVAHLWKFRKSNPVWRGQPWEEMGIVQMLRDRGFQAGQDSQGIYIEQPGVASGMPGGQRTYYDPQTLITGWQLDATLAPSADLLTSVAVARLVPEDVQMVPSWIIGLILAAYVLTIGPVDYFVLGYFRIRKATWIMFPLVTAFFTLLTVWIAHWYMGSTETGGSIEITDVVDDGIAARRSKIQMLFYGSRSTHRTEHAQSLVVPLSEAFARNYAMQGYSASSNPSILNYAGHFPNSYSVTQVIPQWSPQLIRSTQLELEAETLPFQLDWMDDTLITTDTGRQRLAARLAAANTVPSAADGDRPSEAAVEYAAVVLHGVNQFPIVGHRFFRDEYEGMDFRTRQWSRQFGLEARTIPFQIAQSTVASHRSDMFRLVSQFSPQGSGLLEDLPILDETDERQWALVILQRKGTNYRVWRKLYVIDPAAKPTAEKEQVAE